MIDSIVVTNHLGESMTLELANPEKSGLAVLGIEGLGPSKADVSMFNQAGADGGFFNSARANSRNILLRLQFVGSSPVELTRAKTYKYFPVKRKINIKIYTTNRNVEVDGYVESNEPEIWRKDPGTVISVMCPSAYFTDLDGPLVTTFASITPTFEFPFSNEGESPVLQMGTINQLSSSSVVYTGDASVGVEIYIYAYGFAEGITITLVETGQVMSISDAQIATITGDTIDNGDVIVISTVRGNTFARLTRAGVTHNIRNALGTYPPWFKLEVGDNQFSFAATTGLTVLDFEIKCDLLYYGV